MFRKLMRLLHQERGSKQVAKNRLQLILIQDRVGADEAIMNDLQAKLTQLLGEYFEFPSEGIDMELQRDGTSMALTASIPIKAMKRRSSAEQ
ncbi:MAG: cell division topological specificity factor MinE [Candidatus Poribacteria bacterium]|nr:cell division topological specificity factor MinE [Candidatus Poribacteria bacterium]MDE0506875.1 cell division topological specificity factor MinE [Candidatus Poribacteria bacterium]